MKYNSLNLNESIDAFHNVPFSSSTVPKPSAITGLLTLEFPTVASVFPVTFSSREHRAEGHGRFLLVPLRPD